MSAPYDPRDERGAGARYQPYPSRDERYGGRSPGRCVATVPFFFLLACCPSELRHPEKELTFDPQRLVILVAVRLASNVAARCRRAAMERLTHTPGIRTARTATRPLTTRAARRLRRRMELAAATAAGLRLVTRPSMSMYRGDEVNPPEPLLASLLGVHPCTLCPSRAPFAMQNTLLGSATLWTGEGSATVRERENTSRFFRQAL